MINILQGGALQDRCRSLLLVRGPADQIGVTVVTVGGPDGEQWTLKAAARPPLDGLLRERGLSAHLFEATQLRPDRRYRFAFTIGANTRVVDTHTLPSSLPQDGLTVSVGSCFFEGFNMAARMATVLQRRWLSQRARLQIWTGDNLYLDVPSFGLLSGNRPYAQTLERYLKYFGGTAYMSARALTPNYSTWDDHEFWNNFPEKQPHLTRDDDRQRLGYTRAAWDCLDLFQSSLNPQRRPDLFRPPLDTTRPARSFQFDLWPLSFFFADLRSNRNRQRAGARMMMHGDLYALQTWANTLRGPGVLVLGQPLWIETGGKMDHNPPVFAAEYQAIWAALRAAPFDVLVISGDVHHSRVLECSLGNATNRYVYEFVSSPASHIPTKISTVLPFNVQGGSKVSPPDTVLDGGHKVTARYFFGTAVQNCLGFLRFVPKPDNAVQVEAAFVDYGGKSWPRIPTSAPCQLRSLRPDLARCDSNGPLFTLKRRGP